MGKRVERNKQQKKKKNTIIKFVVLFFILGIMTVICSTSLAITLFNSELKDSNNIRIKQVSNNLNKDKIVNCEYNSEDQGEDVIYLEKYLEQQSLGQMPEDANGEKIVYLTFDDGPSTTVTPMILDILKKENIKATFFVLGQSVNYNEESKNILKREYDEGHSIGNHTYSHNYEYLYPNGIISTTNFVSDINRTNESLKNVLGDDFHTRIIRFPGGYMSWNDEYNVGQYLKDRGYYYIDWNALSKDSEGQAKTAEQLIYEVKTSTYGREKAIILMHDNYGKEETAKALPEIISYLKDKGYKFKTIK